jgi:subtilisin family serine protease
MNRKNNFPFKYYLYLLILLIISIVFWLFILRDYNYRISPSDIFGGDHNQNNEQIGQKGDFRNYEQYLPREYGEIIEIDTNQIEIDSITGRSYLSNLLNVALKNESPNLDKFIIDFIDEFGHENYKITYVDTVINRIQIQLKNNNRSEFKSILKHKMNNYDLLVWDEVLFESSRSFNDSKIENTQYDWFLKAINMNDAWEVSVGNPNIIIAVLDNGFDSQHPELKGKEIKPYNVVKHNNNIQPNKLNHGTHVSATIVGKANNNLGLVGIAPFCSYMPIKVSDDNEIITNSYIIDGILYAIKNKANIINLSLGMLIDKNAVIPTDEQLNYIDFFAKDEELFWDELFKYADKKNVTCVIAAGNNKILTGFDPFQRSQYTIKVGAVNEKFKKADFSNFGEYTTIYAPGVSIYSAKPNTSFELLDGTSMAAPIVSGAIALLKSKDINISNREIIKRLKLSAVKKNDIDIINVANFLNTKDRP